MLRVFGPGTVVTIRVFRPKDTGAVGDGRGHAGVLPGTRRPPSITGQAAAEPAIDTFPYGMTSRQGSTRM